MINNQYKVIAITMLIIFLSPGVSAQVSVPKFEIGAGLSSFVYQGDLTPSRLGSFRTLRLGINLHATRLLGPSFSARINLAIGSLRGDDAVYDHPEYRQQRNFNFRSPIIELTQLIIWNPLKKNYAKKGFSPYLFAGGGFSYLKIKRDWSQYNAEYFDAVSDVSARLAVDAEHALPRIIPVIPVGLGVRYGLSQRLVLNVESSYRFVFTDYLDGFSQAANPELNDHYHTITIGAIYRIGNKNRLSCPPVSY